MRRRTKPRVVWLPPTNANSIGLADTAGYQSFVVGVTGPVGSFSVGEIPLTIDAQSDPLDATTSLADVESSGYRLRRVVGKLFALQFQSADTSAPQVLVTAGIIVRASQETTGASLASLDATGETRSPGQIRNYGDPWIWRRTWLLGNNLSTVASAIGDLPESNLEYGSVADGPHVNQKTARIVSAEERLFLTVSSTVVTAGVDLLASTFIITDMRILASMRTNSGNRRNASR